MTDDLLLMRQTLDGRNEGKARRTELPRKALGALAPRHEDFDPVSCLEEQGTSRVPSLLPLRYERMAASQFAFLRGAAAVMAYDLAIAPSTRIEAQICGDAHVSNFGIFASPERHLVFDVNDFDETLPGPFEWDVKRMAASAAVSMIESGFAEPDVVKTVRSAVCTYRTAMLAMAEMDTMAVWYLRMDVDEQIKIFRSAFKDEHGRPVDNLVAKARRSDSKRAFSKLTGIVDGRLEFIPDPPIVVPIRELLLDSPMGASESDVIAFAIDHYASSLTAERAHVLAEFEQVDMARKVVGVGSVGTRCFLILLLGRSIHDPLILQVKEAMPSVYEAHLGPSAYENAGERVVRGQRLMQSTSDIFLGYMRAPYSDTETHDFYLRQFHDAKASVDLSLLHDVATNELYFKTCAWALARAHARSGNRAAIAAYLGNTDAFEKAITKWSMSYVERNAADYQEFVAAIASGRLPSMEPATPEPSSAG